MSEVRYCANPDCRDDDGNRTVIDPKRVEAKPTIKACSPACKQAAHRLRRAEQGDGARDVTGGQKRRGGERGPDLPYRRTADVLFDGEVGQVLRAWFGDDVEAERAIRSDLYRAASEANRGRIVRLEKGRRSA
jgi:hypothetical protein